MHLKFLRVTLAIFLRCSALTVVWTLKLCVLWGKVVRNDIHSNVPHARLFYSTYKQFLPITIPQIQFFFPNWSIIKFPQRKLIIATVVPVSKVKNFHPKYLSRFTKKKQNANVAIFIIIDFIYLELYKINFKMFSLSKKKFPKAIDQ